MDAVQKNIPQEPTRSMGKAKAGSPNEMSEKNTRGDSLCFTREFLTESRSICSENE